MNPKLRIKSHTGVLLVILLACSIVIAIVSVPSRPIMNAFVITIVVLTAATVIEDLLQCLENNPNSKREKRIERLTFMHRMFEDYLSEELCERISECLNRLMDLPNSTAHSLTSGLEQLKEEELRCPEHNNGDSILLPKRDPSIPFVQPLKQAFNDVCKQRLNSDGVVYDIFFDVVRVAYTDLMRSYSPAALRGILLASSKLVLKGGAATGKFLFRNDESMWSSMSQKDKQYVMDTFINGGDNDTSIVFDKSVLDLGFSVSQVNNEIASIMNDMQQHILRVTREHDVQSRIDAYIASALTAPVEFDGVSFQLSKRDSSSFVILDKDEQHSELVYLNNNRANLFGSQSYCEFPDSKGDMIKFYLARVKVAYKASSMQENFSLNCYAECLDVSAACIDSAVLCRSEYKPIYIM